jgi:CRP-like cAMP-binding protein
MSIATVTLKQFTLFNALPDKVIEQLSQHASLAEVPRRKIVMQKGEVAHSLGLLLEGRLQGVDITLDGHEAGLYFIEQNDFFGELSVIDRLPAPEFVVALSTARFIMIPANIIQQLIKVSPEIAAIINHRLAQRLRESIAQRSLLAMPTPLQRICAQLLKMSRKSKEGEITITHVPTHQELAIMINVTRETVTRAFQKLQKNHIIKRDGAILIIKNVRYIRDTAQGIENISD